MTVSISYSPRARSSRTWSRTSPRTTLTCSITPDRANSLCGTQSRTRQTTSAPELTRRRTSQPPSSPVAPVTKVGRSSQKLSIRSVRHPPLLKSTSKDLIYTGGKSFFACLIPKSSKAPGSRATVLPNSAYHVTCPCIARNCRDDRRRVGHLAPVAQARLPRGCLHRYQDNQKCPVPIP